MKSTTHTWLSWSLGISVALFCFVLATETLREHGIGPEPAMSNPTLDIHNTIAALVGQGTPVEYLAGFNPGGWSTQPIEVPHWPKSWLDIRKQAAAYRLGPILFATVVQPSSHYPFAPNNGVDLGPSGAWAGVLVSPDGGFSLSPSSLTPWFEVKNADPTVPHNVVGIFTSKKTLYIDIADAHGAGSGEGLTTRLSSVDGGRTWKRVGCYYFLPEAYHTMYQDPTQSEQGLSIYGGPLRPHALAPISGCQYQH
jgi:hypothetical protein